MTQQDPAPPAEPPHVPDPLVACVLDCQQAYFAWQAATDEQTTQHLGAAYRALVEELWQHLEDSLSQVARGWVRSQMAPDLDSLAKNLFGNIILNLPKLKIDPNRNVRNLLLTVARRGQADEYRRAYADEPRRQPKKASDEDVPVRTSSLDALPDLVDQKSVGIEDTLAREIDEEAILRAVLAYWPNTLNADDYLIMRLRWRTDPQCSFREIADQLGPGWEEATVRQRHHRILAATRKYLRERGLLDDTTE